MRSLWLKIIFALLLLSVVASLSANYLLSSWLNGELALILNKDPNRKYDISYEDFAINIALGEISINQMSVTPISSDFTNEPVPIVAIKEFVVDGVVFRKLLFNKEIVTKTLLIKEPVVNFQVSATQKVIGDSKEINLLWKDILTRVTVQNFEIKEGAVTIYNKTLQRKQLTMSPVDLRITDIVIDTTTIDDPFPLYYESIELAAENLEIAFEDFFLKTSRLDATDHSLRINGFQLLPENEENQPQVMTINAESIQVSHFNWGFLEEQFFLKIKKLEVNNMGLSVLQNSTVAQKRSEKPLLPTMLRKLPLYLHMDTVVFKKSKIIYEQLNQTGDDVGKIEFHDFYASVYNITNDKSVLENNHYTTIDIETNFMKSGHLKSQFKFDLTDKKDSFTGSGRIDDMNISELNAILNPLTSVHADGQMSLFDFNLTGDKWKSKGSLEFVYDKLKVQVYNKENEKKNLLLSSLSKLVIKGSNRKEASNYRTGNIYTTRISDRSFFNYLWNSLKSGILEIVAPGLKTGKDRKKKSRKK